MNIVAPNFIDLTLDFRKKHFLNIASIKPIGGGVTPLLNIFDEINWIKPSAFNPLCKDDVQAYFFDIGDGVKRTAVDYSFCELYLDVDFAHVMYGDYFALKPASGVTLSVDFAGLADVDHVERILSCSNVKYVFCSEHDSWAESIYLISKSRNRAIIWHSPKCVLLYFNQSIFKVPNIKFVPTKKIVVGAGDLLAVSIMLALYKKEFKDMKHETITESIITAMNLVTNRCFT